MADHRTYMLSQAANVQTYTDSSLTAADVLEMGADHIAIATGATWRINFTGLQHQTPVSVANPSKVVSPDQVLAGVKLEGKVLIYDDDHYYLASALAEQLATDGLSVTLVTPAADIAEWTHNTLENEHIQVRLRELGVGIICKQEMLSVQEDHVTLGCIYMETPTEVATDFVIPVTARDADDQIYRDLLKVKSDWADAGIQSIAPVGDCLNPATIAMAVHAGHEYAQHLDKSDDERAFFRRELGLGGE